MKTTIRMNQLRVIIDSYQYPMPFKEHLQDFFRQNKNAGSKDRKELRHLCNSYFRLGKVLIQLSFEERAYLADFLFNDRAILENHFNLDFTQNFVQKIKNIQLLFPDFKLDGIFPFEQQISEVIKSEKLFESYLHQASLWIKVSPGKDRFVATELELKQIPYEKINNLSWKFNPDEKLSELNTYSKSYFRIQDLSTQTTADYFQAADFEKWWDCCAGAGGKSLSLMESTAKVSLYASDIRPGILNNLKERFRNHHVHPQQVFECNLEKESPNLPLMDGIIVDAPCSGSGTWSRNPEHLYYFKEESIEEYGQRQERILDHVFPLLKVSKPLIYITCSIYKRENEEVVSRFCAKHSVKIEEQKYIEGYKNGAENIFLCRMIKSEEAGK